MESVAVEVSASSDGPEIPCYPRHFATLLKLDTLNLSDWLWLSDEDIRIVDACDGSGMVDLQNLSQKLIIPHGIYARPNS